MPTDKSREIYGEKFELFQGRYEWPKKVGISHKKKKEIFRNCLIIVRKVQTYCLGYMT